MEANYEGRAIGRFGKEVRKAVECGENERCELGCKNNERRTLGYVL